MACRLIGAKPLSEWMLEYRELDPAYVFNKVYVTDGLIRKPIHESEKFLYQASYFRLLLSNNSLWPCDTI